MGVLRLLKAAQATMAIAAHAKKSAPRTIGQSE
jgi:hypothetical protein